MWYISLLLLGITQILGAPVYWVDWLRSTSEGGVTKYYGVIKVPSADGLVKVTVKYTPSKALSKAQMSPRKGIDFWQSGKDKSPYKSKFVDNDPRPFDLMAMKYAQKNELEFSHEIDGLALAVLSVNGANTWRFDKDFSIYSYGCGYWGCGTIVKEISQGKYVMTGDGEKHGVLGFSGPLHRFSFETTVDEDWNGFTIGVFGLAVARKVDWVEWSSTPIVEKGVRKYVGKISFLTPRGTDSVTVKYTPSKGVKFVQNSKTATVDYWKSASKNSPYKSFYIANAPPSFHQIAIKEAQMNSFQFSKPVKGLVLAVMGTEDNSYTFSHDFTIFSSGEKSKENCGYWGCGKISKKVRRGKFIMEGTGKPHGVLGFCGRYSSFSFHSTRVENMNGFTLGVSRPAPRSEVGWNEFTIGAGRLTRIPPPRVSWIDWTGQKVENGVTKYLGTMTFNGKKGNTKVQVKYTPSKSIAFFQTSTGIDYWKSGSRNSPFRSKYIANDPKKIDIIAIKKAQSHTFEFSSPVCGLALAMMSAQSNSFVFKKNFKILSSGEQSKNNCGYLGCGTITKTVNTGKYIMSGTGKPHGVLGFNGYFKKFSFESSNDGDWTGFTLGAVRLPRHRRSSKPTYLPKSNWGQKIGNGIKKYTGTMTLPSKPTNLPKSNWVKWTGQKIENGIKKYVGTMTLPSKSGKRTIQVKYTPSKSVLFVQTSTGIDYWKSVSRKTSPFVSKYVRNSPKIGIIAVKEAQKHTFEFSAPVTNLILALISSNSNPYIFKKNFKILSSGEQSKNNCGYFGCGTITKTLRNGKYIMSGTGKPHGVLGFRGNFKRFSFESPKSDTWNGFTIGGLRAGPMRPPLQVNWVDWTGKITENGLTKYIGKMTVPTSWGNIQVEVKYSASKSVAFVQTSTGTDYWRSGSRNSPYRSKHVPNDPPKIDIIANSKSQTHNFEFSLPIQNLALAVMRVNSNPYTFTKKFYILSSGEAKKKNCGYWGCGTITKTVSNGKYILGGTGQTHGVIGFKGTFKKFSFTSTSDNTQKWNGFTIGAFKIASVVPPYYNWVDWSDKVVVENGITKYLGTIKAPTRKGTVFVNVKYSASKGINMIQHSTGIDYWKSGSKNSPYTSKYLANDPQKIDIISTKVAQTNTFEFSPALSGIALAVLSDGSTSYTFDRDFKIFSQGDGKGKRICGYYGCGRMTKSISGGKYTMAGYDSIAGVLGFKGKIKKLEFTSNPDGAWNGFTIGARGLRCLPPPPHVYWSSWKGKIVHEDGKTKYLGNIKAWTKNGLKNVIVKYTPSIAISFVEETGSTKDYFKTKSGLSAYISRRVANRPSGLIAINVAQTNEFEFSETVLGLSLAVVGMNSNTYTFDKDFKIYSNGDGIKKGCGHFGCGTFQKTKKSNGKFVLGATGEAHGVIGFEGTFDKFVFTSNSVQKNWNGFTIGTYGVVQKSVAMNAGVSYQTSEDVANSAISEGDYEYQHIANFAIDGDLSDLASDEESYLAFDEEIPGLDSDENAEYYLALYEGDTELAADEENIDFDVGEDDAYLAVYEENAELATDEENANFAVDEQSQDTEVDKINEENADFAVNEQNQDSEVDKIDEEKPDLAIDAKNQDSNFAVGERNQDSGIDKIDTSGVNSLNEQNSALPVPALVGIVVGSIVGGVLLVALIAALLLTVKKSSNDLQQKLV